MIKFLTCFPLGFKARENVCSLNTFQFIATAVRLPKGSVPLHHFIQVLNCKSDVPYYNDLPRWKRLKKHFLGLLKILTEVIIDY